MRGLANVNMEELLSRTCSMPLIVWSGDRRSIEAKQTWLEEHGIRTLPKPFEIEDLYGLLDSRLTHRHHEGPSTIPVAV